MTYYLVGSSSTLPLIGKITVMQDGFILKTLLGDIV